MSRFVLLLLALAVPPIMTAHGTGRPTYSETTVEAAAYLTGTATAIPALVKAGQTETLSMVVRSHTSVGPALVDLEVNDARGLKILQLVKRVQLTANEVVRVERRYLVPATAFAGTYRVNIGAFGPKWSPIYLWNESAASFDVRGHLLPDISIAGTATPTHTSPGRSVTLASDISIRGHGLVDLVADIEVHHASGKVYQHAKHGIRLQNNRLVHLSTKWNVAESTRSGVYVMTIGVFGSGWTPLYAWNGDAARIVVR